MFVAGLTADVFATNCYVLAVAGDGPCVVVDPGFGVVDPLRELVAERHLQPAAVLLTHGHVDHTADASAVCDEWDIPAYIHSADRGQLADPATGIPTDLRALFGEDFMWREPQRVLTYPQRTLQIAGLDLEVIPAPGHTRGSILLLCVDDHPICCAGDVLFAGSIGRTDLPGGDLGEMRQTLRDTILSLDDATAVLPGHGPATTIGRERRGNPYLQGEVIA